MVRTSAFAQVETAACAEANWGGEKPDGMPRGSFSDVRKVRGWGVGLPEGQDGRPSFLPALTLDFGLSRTPATALAVWACFGLRGNSRSAAGLAVSTFFRHSQAKKDCNALKRQRWLPTVKEDRTSRNSNRNRSANPT